MNLLATEHRKLVRSGQVRDQHVSESGTQPVEIFTARPVVEVKHHKRSLARQIRYCELGESLVRSPRALCSVGVESAGNNGKKNCAENHPELRRTCLERDEPCTLFGFVA